MSKDYVIFYDIRHRMNGRPKGDFPWIFKRVCVSER